VKARQVLLPIRKDLPNNTIIMALRQLNARILLVFTFFFAAQLLFAQDMKWAAGGNSYFSAEGGDIVRYELPGLTKTVFIDKKDLTPEGKDKPLKVENFAFSEDGQKLLVYTNSQWVWRYKTRGDYWVLDLPAKKLRQLGKDRPESSLMFAKFSPDGSKVAYVSERNIYVEDLEKGIPMKMTYDNGTKKLINGTFDWVYEEEFSLRDGFRWSPDSRFISFWQIDANQIRDFYMINNTDSIYSQIVPVEYPKVGDPPSPARIGVVDVNGGKTTWMKVPGDPQQHYIVRMEWAPDGKDVVLQQLNRKQNESKIMLCNPQTGDAQTIYSETDEAWVAHVSEWSDGATGWHWVNSGKDFIWVSEKDGWRHLYLVSRDGKMETRLTKGDFDVIETELIDDKNGGIYFYASPGNPLQQYLYHVTLDGKGKVKQLSPAHMEGTHSYAISPNGKFARYDFSNHFTPSMETWISLPDHKPLPEQENIFDKYDPSAKANANVEFFKITTDEGVELDGWVKKPDNFDPTKKYPVMFFVYSYPGTSTVKDTYSSRSCRIYDGDLAEDGYLYISVDNRGSVLPKGRKWRKAIYQKVGQVTSYDQAQAAKKIMQWQFVDTSRVAVWGWSGGGSTTLDLLFRYPEIYKTGVSVAPVTNLLLYDNIYTERFMGLPQENMADYVEGSPLTHAKNLRGNLLLVHGTGDDNVHFQNAEMLVNELVKHNKQFQYMAYPNRSHGLREGSGTSRHLVTMCSKFIRENCPPGPINAGEAKKP
jgi:dipeptidyl-peptidase-4